MKVKVFDEEHESDLESSLNSFISDNGIDVIDIKFSSSCSVYGEEQVFCFSALVMYVNRDG